MTDDLRARIAEALTNTPATSTCALCAGDVEALADAVMAVVEPAIQYARDFSQGRCRHCNIRTEAAWNPGRKSRPHSMRCPLYVGPVEHTPVAAINGSTIYGGANITCRCGANLESGDQACPNAAEIWRGPLPPREVSDA